MQPFFGPRFGNPSSMHRWGREARTALDEARERVAPMSRRARRTRSASPRAAPRPTTWRILGVWRARRERGPQRRRDDADRAQGRARRACTRSRSEGGEERLLAVDADGRRRRRVVRRARARRRRGLLGDVGEQRDRHGAGRSARSPSAREGARRRVPHRRGAGVRQGRRSTRARTPFDLLVDLGPQDRRAEGNRRAVHPPRHADRAADVRRLAGPRPPPGHGERRDGGRPRLRRRARRRRARGGVRAASSALRDRLEAALLARVPDAVIHGRGAPRAPHISNISVPGTDSESMLMALDLRGIACSAGSACQSGSITPSHVLERDRRVARPRRRRRSA